MRRYTKTAPRWNTEMQRAAQRAKQAARDELPDEDSADRRPALTLLIATDDGPPMIHWRLTPIRGQIRRYRVTQAETGEVVTGCDGERVGGGRDSILREAAKMLPKYSAIDSILE